MKTGLLQCNNPVLVYLFIPIYLLDFHLTLGSTAIVAFPLLYIWLSVEYVAYVL